VHTTVHFDDQTMLGAAEVDNEPPQRMLAPKLETTQLAVPQSLP
jgi:hypothetical protein